MFIRSQRADVNKGNTLCFPPSLQALLTPLKRLYAKYFNMNPSRIDKRGFTRQHKALWTLWGAYLNTKKLSYSSSRPPIMALLIADLISFSDVFFFFFFCSTASDVPLHQCHQLNFCSTRCQLLLGMVISLKRVNQPAYPGCTRLQFWKRSQGNSGVAQPGPV